MMSEKQSTDTAQTTPATAPATAPAKAQHAAKPAPAGRAAFRTAQAARPVVDVPTHTCVATLVGTLGTSPQVRTVSQTQVANAVLTCGKDSVGISAWSGNNARDRAEAFARIPAGSQLELSGSLDEQTAADGERRYWNVRVNRYTVSASPNPRAVFFAVGDLADLGHTDEQQPWIELHMRQEGRGEKVYEKTLRIMVGVSVEQALMNGEAGPGSLVRVQGVIYQRPRMSSYGVIEGQIHALYAHILDGWNDELHEWSQLAQERGGF